MGIACWPVEVSLVSFGHQEVARTLNPRQLSPIITSPSLQGDGTVFIFIGQLSHSHELERVDDVPQLPLAAAERLGWRLDE